MIFSRQSAGSTAIKHQPEKFGRTLVEKVEFCPRFEVFRRRVLPSPSRAASGGSKDNEAPACVRMLGLRRWLRLVKVTAKKLTDRFFAAFVGTYADHFLDRGDEDFSIADLARLR